MEFTSQSAINELKKDRIIDDKTEHSQVKYLNNIIKSYHGRVKRRLRPMLGLKSLLQPIDVYKAFRQLSCLLKINLSG
ncbi:MAG: DDE-type integrase/transposase/recombinase [Candidatus Midichloriaceae bacterium]